jgi:hypothetical protein
MTFMKHPDRSSRLILNGRLTVPLYHGTSTLFYDSIIQSGLGGRNVVEDLGIQAAARLLLERCEALQLRQKCLSEFEACVKIAEGPSTQNLSSFRLFSFRYGGAYVSPSRTTAATYARLYDCGSEALTYTLRFLQRMSEADPNLPERPEFTTINALSQRPRRPLVIEAHDVDPNSLRTEQGRDINDALNEIECLLTEKDDMFDIMLQQTNFELLKPIPAQQLRFYGVKYRTNAFDDFELIPMGNGLASRASDGDAGG